MGVLAAAAFFFPVAAFVLGCVFSRRLGLQEVPSQFTSQGKEWDGCSTYRNITDFVIFHKVKLH